MTAIADILVNSKLSDLSEISKLQLSNSNLTSQISSSSSSFGELLTSFRSENTKSEKVETPEKTPVSDETTNKSEKVEKSSEKDTANETNKVSDENKTESKNETVKSEDKTEVQNSDESQKDTNQVESKVQTKEAGKDNEKTLSKLQKNDEKGEKSVNQFAKIENKTAENLDQTKTSSKNLETEKKTEDSKGKSKKLENEYNRLDSIVEKNPLDETALITQAEEIASLENTKINLKENVQKNEDSSEELVKLSDSDSLASNNRFAEILDTENNIQDPKVSKFDKDGKITVQDFRTEVAEKNDNEPKLKTEVRFDSNNSATITMDVANNVQTDLLSANTQQAASDGSNFQAMLNNQIQAQTPEIVKTGSIILKDNDKGTINLVLHPDDLGNVKIHISMDGKTVNGHITVNSKEALQVFKDNAETLREAFIKNGFDAANFDVAFNNSSSGQNQDFNQNFNESQFVGKKTYSDLGSGESAVAGEKFLEENENFSNYSINIVA